MELTANLNDAGELAGFKLKVLMREVAGYGFGTCPLQKNFMFYVSGGGPQAMDNKL